MKQIDQTAEIKRLQEALKESQKRADKAEAKNQALNDKLDAKRKELKVAKSKLKKDCPKGGSDRGTEAATERSIAGHQFIELIVRMSCMLYVRVNCGLRSVCEILKVIQECIPGILGDKIPSYQTIENWIKLCGLNINKNACKEIGKNAYAMVVDESITIGSQKLLLILGIPSQHSGRALKHEDVIVLGLFVSGSWKADDVSSKLVAIADEVGHDPDYVLSDNGHNLVRAAESAEIPHHADISHTFGNILKDNYGNCKDFNDFVTIMGKARLSYHLTNKAYLLPPKQRAICRFMNCFGWVEWARKMDAAFDKLTDDEREAFKFVKEHSALIDELCPIMDEYRFVEQMIKTKGLSWANVNECVKHIIQHLMPMKKNNFRMGTIAAQMCLYLRKEARLLKSVNDVHNVSSDIIESIFGTYKRRKSPNNLFGVTGFALFIPSHTKLISKEHSSKFDFKESLESTRIKDLKEWQEKKLLPNEVTKRISTLKLPNVS